MVQQTRHKQWFSIQMWDILSLFLVMEWSHDMLRFWRLFYRPIWSTNTASEVFFFPQIQLWCRIQATASQSHFLRMALPFQWQLEILMRRNEATQGGATRWCPRYLLQMFTRDGSRWFVDERSFKLDHHSDSQMRRSWGIWNLGAAAGHLRKVTLKFCIWNQTAGFVCLLTVSSCWPRRVGAGPDFIFRYSAKAALAWVQKHLSVKCLVHTCKTLLAHL